MSAYDVCDIHTVCRFSLLISGLGVSCVRSSVAVGPHQLDDL